VLKKDSIEVLNTLLSFLNSREREVISKRFGIGGAHPESRDSLAEQFEVSIETIRGWETKIIRKLSKLSRKTGINQDMLS
jgi:DNA-directed RNA polymerase sigma subunit (sigma70/sigma32)